MPPLVYITPQTSIAKHSNVLSVAELQDIYHLFTGANDRHYTAAFEHNASYTHHISTLHNILYKTLLQNNFNLCTISHLLLIKANNCSVHTSLYLSLHFYPQHSNHLLYSSFSHQHFSLKFCIITKIAIFLTLKTNIHCMCKNSLLITIYATD